MRFTTRPEIRGTFGVVATTHWIATAIGMGVLERGGNAFDAAVAAGFALQVVEPHLNGPGGDMPALVYPVREGRVRVLCGQGTAPARATVAHYRAEGLETVPGSGLLATVIPGAFDAWMLMLREWGTLTVAEALAPALALARDGHPLLDRAAGAIAAMAEFFRAEWPGSAAVWLPGGAPPAPGARFRQPALAATWERLLREAAAARGREAQIEAARRAWAQGFVAEAVGRFVASAELADETGARRRGVLTADDMAGWRATVEDPVSVDYGPWTVFKTGPWGQGPCLLQALAILRGLDLGEIGGAPAIHLTVEAMKLAMADREAFYGDPAQADIPLATLLSEPYAAERRRLIGETASQDQRPGRPAGFERLADASVARAGRGARGAGAGEPTFGARVQAVASGGRRGDTVHLDVIDAKGNMVSATPSGGWLQSSPVIPELGFALNSRAQMFWLDEGLPSTLAPGRRPRTTLSPSLAAFEGRPALAFGTPGGDQQDQWQLAFFLKLAHGEPNLQAAIDGALFHSGHVPSSFAPRAADPGHLAIEPSAGEDAIAELRRRGHRVEVAEPWTLGRLTAAARDPDGGLRAAATPRLMQAYAAGR